MKLGLVFARPTIVATFAVACAACSPATSSTARSGSATLDRYANTSPAGPVYRFDFTLNASGSAAGAVGGDAGRHYSMVLEQGAEGRVEAGSNVLLGSGEHAPRTDVGVKVRCKYDLAGTDPLLHAVLSMSNAGSEASDHAIHKIEMVGDALVTPGKPALVATIADPSTQSRYELTVAATRLR